MKGRPDPAPPAFLSHPPGKETLAKVPAQEHRMRTRGNFILRVWKAPLPTPSSGLQPHNSSAFRTKEGSCWGPNSPRPTRPTPARGNRSPEALPLAKTVGNEGLRLRAASRPVTLHFLTLCYRLFPFLPVRPRQRKWVNKVS